MSPKQPEHVARPGKLKSSLIALGSAAVLTVYAAGYERTEAAAQRFANEGDDRLPPRPSAHTGIVGAPTRESAGTSTSGVQPHAANASAVAAHTRREAPHEPATKLENTQARTTSKTPLAAPLDSGGSTSRTTAVAAAAAPAAAVAAATPAPSAVPAKTDTATADSMFVVHYKDGTYTGWGTSRHGDIQATVMVKDGRVSFAAISECLTQYSCSWIISLPPQVVERQSAEVDYVSGATQSTRAFYYAVLEALAKAK